VFVEGRENWPNATSGQAWDFGRREFPPEKENIFPLRMGAIFSSLTREDIREIKSKLSFTEKEVKRYYRRFRDLDRDESGSIPLERLLCIPELAINPLSTRVLKHIRDCFGEQLDFKRFLELMEIYSRYAPGKEKVGYAFRILDLRGDGQINIVDLKNLGRIVYGGLYSEEKLQEIAARTMEKYDREKRGYLDMSDIEGSISDLKEYLTVL
jgi:serine/threonine-protein phosphatase 2B regulatory subunit